MGVAKVLAGLVLTLALVACTAKPQPELTLAPGPLSKIPSSSLPRPLTAGEPARLGFHSPNVSVGEALRYRILISHRYARPEQAAALLGFAPRLPKDPGGASVEYLLVQTLPFKRGTSGTFWALYSGGALQIAEWRPGKNEWWRPEGIEPTQTVHGLPAYPRMQQGQANVLWKEGGILHNVWYSGSLKDVMRIAESFPRR